MIAVQQGFLVRLVNWRCLAHQTPQAYFTQYAAFEARQRTATRFWEIRQASVDGDEVLGLSVFRFVVSEIILCQQLLSRRLFPPEGSRKIVLKPISTKILTTIDWPENDFVTYNLSKSDEITTETEDDAIATDAIQG